MSFGVFRSSSEVKFDESAGAQVSVELSGLEQNEGIGLDTIANVFGEF